MANEDYIGVGSPDGTIVGRSDAPVTINGSSLNFGSGIKGAALTAQLTSITIADAAGTPDYAIQAVINTNAYGFASAQEAISFLYVVQNLQVRLAQVEARLEAAGLITAN